jgi:hypothetical protein
MLALCASVLFGPAVVVADASAGDGKTLGRTSFSTQMTRSARDRGEDAAAMRFAYPALESGGVRATDSKAVVNSEAQSATASSPNTDFWFYTADIVLFNDRDGDGYFHGIDLLFDADTIYGHAEVYAVAYLSLEGGAWNEYAVTDAFPISGTDVDDEYIIVTELVSGYPTGSYDLLIELFDAVDGRFLASYGPLDSPALGYLALEDAGRDPLPGTTTTVIVREGGGGSLGWLSLLGLLLAAVPVSRRPVPAP